jgi:hypothetical protein
LETLGSRGFSSSQNRLALKLAHSPGSTTVHEMGAQIYIPNLGRFTQVDPIEGGVDKRACLAHRPYRQE